MNCAGPPPPAWRMPKAPEPQRFVACPTSPLAISNSARSITPGPFSAAYVRLAANLGNDGTVRSEAAMCRKALRQSERHRRRYRFTLENLLTQFGQAAKRSRLHRLPSDAYAQLPQQQVWLSVYVPRAFSPDHAPNNRGWGNPFWRADARAPRLNSESLCYR